MIKSKIPLDLRLRLLDELGALAEVLPMADQLQRPEWRRTAELGLGPRLGDRFGVVSEIQGFDGNYVALDRKGSEQQIGEPPGFLRSWIGPSLVGDIPRDPAQRLTRGVHHLVHPGRRREQSRQITDCELDPVEDL